MTRTARFSKLIRLNSPFLVAAWPGMGEVAYTTALHLIRKLGAQEFCSIDGSKYFYPSGIKVNKGIASRMPIPENKFFFWQDKAKNIELIIFLCSAQPDLAQSEEYANLILDICSKVCRQIKCVFTFAALPATIEHVQKPKIFAAATSKIFLPRLKSAGIELINKSQVSGMNGLFIGAAKQRFVDGICLLSEVPLYTVQIENPRAAIEIIEKFSKLINIKVDISKLYKDAEQMEGQINSFIEYFKDSLHASEEQPISQEELERIKHALSQYTKLPNSAKMQIEKLFDEAKRDLSKAKELKVELDKWHIYSEYEDRFLDLFKKSKDN